MRLIEVNKVNELLIEQLFEVWDKSVRETHLFLSDSKIKGISNYILKALTSIAHLIIAVNDENEPVGFMEIEESWECFLFLLNI